MMGVMGVGNIQYLVYGSPSATLDYGIRFPNSHGAHHTIPYTRPIFNAKAAPFWSAALKIWEYQKIRFCAQLDPLSMKGLMEFGIASL